MLEMNWRNHVRRYSIEIRFGWYFVWGIPHHFLSPKVNLLIISLHLSSSTPDDDVHSSKDQKPVKNKSPHHGH